MNICMISSTPLPPQEGIGYYTWNLSRYLKSQGHKVQIITRGGGSKTKQEVVDGIPIWRPTFLPFYPMHVHLHGLYVDRVVREIESEVDLFHMHSPLVREPTTKRPVLVTVHTPMKSDTAAVSADTFLGRLIKLQAPVSIALERGLFNRADALTAVANSVAKELSEYGVRPEKVGVLGNGVDTEMFSPCAEINEVEPGYALTVARLAPRKGLQDLLHCAEMVVKRMPGFRFLIAGSGPAEAEMRAEITRRGLQDAVTLLGHVANRQELIWLYRNARVFVHPAHYEGLPTVLLEAMACGQAVVTTAVSGALDVVEHGVNGFLVPPHAPSQLAEAICQVIGNDHLRHNLKIAARKTVQDRFSWQHIGQAYIQQYEALAA
jgi:glycosyltransferase involved in cell wall biosynthesis